MEISQVRTHLDPSGVTLIELIGEHDLASVDDLQQAIDAALAHEGGLLVDLSQTTFLDSTTIGALFRALDRLQAQQRQLVMQVDGSRPVLRMLEIAGLAPHVPMHRSRVHALTAAANAQPASRSADG